MKKIEVKVNKLATDMSEALNVPSEHINEKLLNGILDPLQESIVRCMTDSTYEKNRLDNMQYIADNFTQEQLVFLFLSFLETGIQRKLDESMGPASMPPELAALFAQMSGGDSELLN